MSRIAAATLSAAERRLIDYLFSLPEYDLATLTTMQLGEQAGASRATIDRLARKFGFAGQREFRHALLRGSRAMKAGIDELESSSPFITSDDTATDIAYKVFNNASIRALKFGDLLAASDALERLLGSMLEARDIRIFGAGASAVVGIDMHQRLMRLGLSLQFAQDVHTQMAQAALMGPQDLAIAISYSGLTRTTVEAAATAKSKGALVAGILGKPQSPLGDLCDIVVQTPPGAGLYGTDAVMARILQMMFNEALFHCLVARKPALLEKIREIDQALNVEKLKPIPRIAQKEKP